jgi:hypothetical protein
MICFAAIANLSTAAGVSARNAKTNAKPRLADAGYPFPIAAQIHPMDCTSLLNAASFTSAPPDKAEHSATGKPFRHSHGLQKHRRSYIANISRLLQREEMRPHTPYETRLICLGLSLICMQALLVV